MRRFPAAIFVALILLLAGASSAGAWSNGDPPPSAVAPIASGVSCDPLAGQLENHAAAAYNSMALGAGQRLPTNGCDSALRPVDRQVYWRNYWCARGLCGNAAFPGTSNHGWGTAADVATFTQGYIRLHGARYRWAKTEALGEPWHFNYVGGYNRPDPGANLHDPILRRGSGGPGQNVFVRKLQKLLRGHGEKTLKVTGEFGKATAIAVRRFQHAQHLKINGIVSRRVWKRLRRPATKPIKTTPKVVPAVGGGTAAPPKKPTKPKPAKPKPKKPKGPAWGIDVSSNNGDVKWKAVRKDGASFAVVKATEGQDYIDAGFGRAKMRAVTEAGLVPGAYHYLRPRADRVGAKEAAWFSMVVGRAGFGKGWLPPVLDVEETTLSPAATCRYVGSWLRLVRRNLGVKAIVYTFPSFAQTNFSDCAWLGEYRLWIAHLGVSKPSVPAPWGRHLIWQYSWTGRVAGISGDVDLDKIVGGRAALVDLRVKKLPKRARRAPRARVQLPLEAEPRKHLINVATPQAEPLEQVPAPEGEEPMSNLIQYLLKQRPTETVTGPPFGLVVLGYATQVGLPPAAAGLCAVVAAFGPLVVSETVSRIRASR